MKRTRLVATILIAVLLCLSVCGCGQKISSPALGDWAYIHDTATQILKLTDDGEAIYKGISYKFTDDGTFITLKSDKDEIKLRYVKDGEDLIVYEPTMYVYDGDTTPTGLIGTWKNAENNWSFEFTDNGEFKEDGYFPGYYTVNPDDGTFKLVYNDHFEDTTVFYSIDGKELTIEYPWQMVPVGSESRTTTETVESSSNGK